MKPNISNATEIDVYRRALDALKIVQVYLASATPNVNPNDLECQEINNIVSRKKDVIMKLKEVFVMFVMHYGNGSNNVNDLMRGLYTNIQESKDEAKDEAINNAVDLLIQKKNTLISTLQLAKSTNSAKIANGLLIFINYSLIDVFKQHVSEHYNKSGRTDELIIIYSKCEKDNLEDIEIGGGIVLKTFAPLYKRVVSVCSLRRANLGTVVLKEIELVSKLVGSENNIDILFSLVLLESISNVFKLSHADKARNYIMAVKKKNCWCPTRPTRHRNDEFETPDYQGNRSVFYAI